MDQPAAHNSVDVHVGERLRKRRTLLRVSQEKLGDQIGVTFQQIQKYEKGANRIGAGQLFQIASFLRVDLGYFFEGLNGAPSEGFSEATVAGISAADIDGHELSRAFARIKDPRARRALVDLARSLADA